MPEADLNATVARRLDLTAELSVVRVRPDSGRVPEFEPGQFITLGLPRDHAPHPAPPSDPSAPQAVRPTRLIRRAYSIASAPQVRDWMEFLVVLVAGGKLTTRLWTVEQEGRVWMDDKVKGSFTLDGVPADQDLVMVSTGTGVAPFVSMLRSFRGRSRWRRLVMIHGVRRVGDLAYRLELETASREDPSVLYVPVVSREPEGSPWRGARGRVQAVLEEEAYHRLVGSSLDPRESHVFLCGNPDMIASTRAMLEARGFRAHTRGEPGNIHFERYW